MRYGIYYTGPESAPLTELGSRWLGRLPFSNKPLTQPQVEGLTGDRVFQLTTSPRRYGFHGTLKAPFHLAAGKTQVELADAVRTLAQSTPSFSVAGLAPRRIGKFLALTETQPSEALNSLASRCITELDTFRAPLSDEDIARRRQANLSAAQDAYMLRWGYPYIFEFFQFHMTLSDKLENEEEAACLTAAAQEFFAPVMHRPHTIGHIGLYVEKSRGAPFTVLDVYPLEGVSR